MAFEEYILLVAFLAVVYSAIARILQFKFTDRAAMKAFQDESKALNKQYKEAAERKDKAATDAIMKQQMELFPKMNKLMMGNLKIMAVVLVFFVGFMAVVNHFDPTMQDDITLALADDGAGCDAQANDGVLSACFTPDRSGTWVAHAKWYNSDSVTGQNATAFMYGTTALDEVYLKTEGQPFAVYTDKSSYAIGESVAVYAHAPDAKKMEVQFDATTRFVVDLPVTIPILNVHRLHEPYWWFLLVTLVSGLLISIGFNIYEKRMKQGEKP